MDVCLLVTWHGFLADELKKYATVLTTHDEYIVDVYWSSWW